MPAEQRAEVRFELAILEKQPGNAAHACCVPLDPYQPFSRTGDVSSFASASSNVN